MRISVIALFVASSILLTGNKAMPANGDPYGGFKVPPPNIPSKTRYTHKFIDVLGSKMAYIDSGTGDPILFLHGQPTSSYLWRNVMPHLEEQGRLVAPDNIGFGLSEQPQLDYTFGDHYRYFEAFVDKLALKNITLVVHDWGSSLGLHYAAQNPDNIKAIVTMESLLAPVFPAKNLETMPEGLGGFFRTVRDPKNGRKLLIEDNAWLSDGGFLQGFIVRPLAEDALRVYQFPHRTEQSRIQVNQWPNEIPIAGKPAETTRVIGNYNRFLEETEIPWLFLYATPGATNPIETVDYWATRGKNIETVYIGHGLHYVQEDQPFAIGRAIADFYRRLEQKHAGARAD